MLSFKVINSNEVKYYVIKKERIKDYYVVERADGTRRYVEIKIFDNNNATFINQKVSYDLNDVCQGVEYDRIDVSKFIRYLNDIIKNNDTSYYAYMPKNGVFQLSEMLNASAVSVEANNG